MDKPRLPVHDHTDHGIRILEEVRRRIARDLHDGPVPMLTSINMKLDIIEMLIDMNPKMAKTQVKDLQKQVTSVVNEIHHLIYDLRPIAVDQVGFVEATKALCRQCESNWHIPIVLTIQEDLVSEGIDPAKQVALYRLIQEILNNIKKHAKAKNIEVTFLHEDRNLIIIIKDDVFFASKKCRETTRICA
ncbi:sensor histidine kinase [Alicyclobacillus macrosporangiidus]|nr:histidine kinase [Alicyclobacillus macrosporangiidus]